MDDTDLEGMLARNRDKREHLMTAGATIRDLYEPTAWLIKDNHDGAWDNAILNLLMVVRDLGVKAQAIADALEEGQDLDVPF